MKNLGMLLDGKTECCKLPQIGKFYTIPLKYILKCILTCQVMVKFMLWFIEQQETEKEQWGACYLDVKCTVHYSDWKCDISWGTANGTEQSSVQGVCGRWEQGSVSPWENSYSFQISHL